MLSAMSYGSISLFILRRIWHKERLILVLVKFFALRVSAKESKLSNEESLFFILKERSDDTS